MKQGRLLILVSLGAACLGRTLRINGKFVVQQRDNHLQQSVIDTLQACNHISETFGDHHTNAAGGPGVATQNGHKASDYVP